MKTQQTVETCSCCGRPFPKAKAVAVVNVAELSDRDVFAYFKRTAPVEDVKFQLRLSSLPADVRTGYEALLVQLERQNGKASIATKREYGRLQQLFRESERTWTEATTPTPAYGLPVYESELGMKNGRIGGPCIIRPKRSTPPCHGKQTRSGWHVAA